MEDPQLTHSMLHGMLLEDVTEYKKGDTKQDKYTFFSSRSKNVVHKQLAYKGSLVVAVSSRDSPVNYKTISGFSINLNCKSSQVYKLNVLQKDLLEGVKHLHDRTEVLHKLEWVQELKIGSLVFVIVPTIPLPVQGVIRFIGELPGQSGTKFGVELMERRGEGTNDGSFKDVTYFECEPCCAVFVSMDQLTQRSFSTNDASFSQSIESHPPSSPDDFSTTWKSNNPTQYKLASARSEYRRTESLDSKSYSPRKTDLTLSYADIKNIKAAGITDMEALAKQQTVLQRYEKESGLSEHLQQAKEELGIEDSLGMDMLMLDRDKQRELLEAAGRQKSEEETTLVVNSKYDVQSPNAFNIPAKELPKNRPDDLQVGSMVQFGTPPHYGVIKWIGHTPSNSSAMARVEMERPFEDFSHHGKSWQQESHQGLLLPLMELYPDKRFSDSSDVSASQPTFDSVFVERVHQNLDDKSGSFEQQMNNFMVKTEESIRLLQNNNNLLQNQLLDVQRNNNQLNARVVYLQNQLTVNQQQLLGLQSMMSSSRLWVVSHDQFVIGKEIGRGAYATVHEATFRGITVAAKRLHDAIASSETREMFQREMDIALSCQHQNIVTFLGATLSGQPVLLMEIMDLNMKVAYAKSSITCTQAHKILHDITMALHFLHTRPDPVIHRDVSSANVLLKVLYNGEWLAKLGDLGTAKIQQQTKTPLPGTIAYAAPEALEPKKHTTKMDVHSFGILIIEALTNTFPYIEKVDTLKTRVQQKFPQYYQLVTSCTNQHSSDRPTMYDVLVRLDEIAAARH
ncbi:uncharacterized protein [Dysidea avara]|uniref:uncharacterized protein isoform X2 n=1 Tax=Dysidea avara TaxID=196820 RepID=UPI00331775F7